MQQPLIYLYCGPGVSRRSIQQTEHSFKQEGLSVERLSPLALKKGEWGAKASLLVMPGGADVPYMETLAGEGNRLIRTYVENGGAFLGICAGSYYASQQIIFAPGTTTEVIAPRELGFFPGTAVGPILAPYDPQRGTGSRAAQISWQGTKFALFYNGGGTFAEAERFSQVQVLATYQEKEACPAILEIEVGKGKAILSAVHCEYDPARLDATDPYIAPLMPALQEGDCLRRKLWRHLLERMNVIPGTAASE